MGVGICQNCKGAKEKSEMHFEEEMRNRTNFLIDELIKKDKGYLIKIKKIQRGIRKYFANRKEVKEMKLKKVSMNR